MAFMNKIRRFGPYLVTKWRIRVHQEVTDFTTCRELTSGCLPPLNQQYINNKAIEATSDLPKLATSAQFSLDHSDRTVFTKLSEPRRESPSPVSE